MGLPLIGAALVANAVSQSSSDAGNSDQGKKVGTALPHSTAVTVERPDVKADDSTHKSSSASAMGDLGVLAMSPALFFTSKLIGPTIDTVKKAGKAAWEGVKEVTKPVVEFAKGAVKTVGEGIWKGLKAIASPFIEVGKAIASPFIEAGKSIWNGIKSIFS